MNKDVAFILKEKLAENSLPFISKYYGLVELVLEHSEGEFNTTKINRLPVATELTYINEDDNLICLSKEELAIPESKLKGIIYFEDKGTRVITNRYQNDYFSRLDLICWINVARVKEDYYERIESSAIGQIQKILQLKQYENIDLFQKFKVKVVGIKPKDSSIFSKYTYDEMHSQYLRPPFTYFSLELEITYSMNIDCLENFETINGEICY